MSQCNFPSCSLSGDVKELKDSMRTLIDISSDQKVIFETVKNSSENLDKLAYRNDKEHDEVFHRLREIEQGHVTKKDITIIMGIFGVVMALVQFIIQH